jgi:hypothetical protein
MGSGSDFFVGKPVSPVLRKKFLIKRHLSSIKAKIPEAIKDQPRLFT